MKKLRLNLDEVRVDSFEIEGIPTSERGTVRARQECPEGGDAGFETEMCGGEEFGLVACSCRCCRCSCPCCCRCRYAADPV
jgi:hypothetical protein